MRGYRESMILIIEPLLKLINGNNMTIKRLILLLVIVITPVICFSQTVQYQTFIYTNDNLAEEISKQSEEQYTRGYIGDLFDASLEAVSGIASGYVTSFIDLGVNTIASLVTRNSRLRKEWEDVVKAENIFETTISTVSEINDFYKEKSFEGAMDPKGMRFDGIGCLRMVDNDTVFYISCHIDRSKINRIINHSKFELVLDSLIISPTHSNLPNTPLNIPFSFEERKNFNLSINIRVTSSWMNEIVQLQKDQLLGEFCINIPVDQKDLNDEGFLRYYRKSGEPSKYKVLGESFIVPRSYMGYRDKNDIYKNIWGTGEYKLSIDLKETCDITEQYRENWKEDRKRRKKMQDNKNILAVSWQMVSNQHWDGLLQSWVITTLKAPAGIITKDIINELGVDTVSPAVPNAKK